MKIKPFLEKKNYHFDEPVAMTTVVFMCEKKNAMVIRAVKISCSRNNINTCYSPAGRSVLGKTVPQSKSKPRAVLKTKGTVFPNRDRLWLVNNISIFPLNLTELFPKETNDLRL